MTSPSSRGRRAFLRAACAAAGVGVLLSRRDARADGEILEEARSQYNFIRVREFGSVRTMYFVAPDGTQYIESRVDRARPQSLDLDYTRTMMAGFLVRPDPRRLLMLGVGGGQMSNYLYARVPGLEIDAVDIDPEVIRLAQKYFDVPTGDPRYRCHADDARLFLERAAPGVTWDMIMLDAFRGVFVPYHLKTVEFYAACLKRLSPRGVVVANLHNVNRMYSYDRETLAAVFPNRYSFVSESGNQ
ncbi:MAG: fused MFS/spermidine synthase, partial [Myxococcales bacterium]|nr:fused MFS/spermidine synthase [Myxococcales bacterium]